MHPKKDLRIFLVDDDPFCLEIHRQYLHNIGYHQIQTFQRGQDCINRLTERPDVIFLDYHMETMNGLEVLKKIKRFDPDIYVVLYSSQDNMQVTINTLKLGAFDYIIKNENELERIKDVLEKIQQITVLLAPHKRRNRLFSFFQS